MSEKIIAVDFDGTLVTHKFPEIGDEVPGAFEWLKQFQAAGAKLILWTIRSNTYQEDAIRYCLLHGVEFWAINAHPGQETWSRSPKAYAHIYIDDAAFGCPLVDHHAPRCFADMKRYEEQLPCTCNERPYADWDVIGPEVMLWLQNDDRFDRSIHPLREGEVP